MAHSEPKKKGWRWGVHRWIVLAAILLGAYLFTGFFGLGLDMKVAMPEVLLPAEPLSESIQLPFLGEFFISNTMPALLLADLIIVLLVIAVNRAIRSGSLVPKGISGALEALVEALYNITQGTAGKWTKQIFPWFVTITLLVLVANWTELIPGVETIGVIHHYEHGEYAIREVGSIGNLPVETIYEPEEGAEGGYALIPFLRVVSTDLNFTVALALVAVVMIQVMGIRAQKGAYFKKFWNTGTLFSKPIFGVIDFGVGVLELVSEFSKVLSFAFRLFGNIFAGSVLLFVIGSLVPIFAQSVFYMLEFFVGLIQAIVFGMLTMVFMSQATQGHGGEHHEEAHAA